MDLLLDPLFRLPFLAGLVVAAAVAVVGLYLRLRGEWLAALGFAHVAGAGGVAGLLLGLPPLAAALGVSAAAVGLKGLLRRSGNDVYAWLILAGWAAMLLGSTLSHKAMHLGEALVDGQLYFASLPELVATLVAAAAAALLLPLLSRRLLRQQLFPGHDAANGLWVRPVEAAFDLAAALTIAVGALVMGVMAIFALVFIPPWIAYGIAGGWRRAVAWSVGIAVGGYVFAYVAAITADLPFAPVLVAALAALAPLRLLAGRRPHASGRKATGPQA